MGGASQPNKPSLCRSKEKFFCALLLVAELCYPIIAHLKVITTLFDLDRGSYQDVTTLAKDGGDASAMAESAGAAPPSLLINVGVGITGTTSLFAATCLLGIPSVHYRRHCLAPTVDGGAAPPPDEWSAWLRAHTDLRMGHDAAIFCLRGGENARNRRRCAEPIRDWADRMRRHADAVARSGLAVTDTPYANAVPYILESARRLRGEGVARRPILAMTERDPWAWADRRIRGHGDVAEILCKEDLPEVPLRKADGVERIGRSLFDMFGCVERALERHGSNASLVFHDVFLVQSLVSLDREMRREVIARALADYQEHWRPLVDYRINLFEREVRMNDTALAQEILAAVPVPFSRLGGRLEAQRT